MGDREATASGGVAGDERGVWRLDIVYEGTRYHGWARQPGHASVQQTIEEALAIVLRERVRLSVAGRTDAGVHAWAQVASFASGRSNVRPDRLRHSLNALLPPDIAVQAVSPAPPGFEARRARSRTYQYRLWLSPVKPVRDRAYVWQVRGSVDVDLLRRAAALLPGRRDFAALTPSAHLYHTCVREVWRSVWRPAGPTFGVALGGGETVSSAAAYVAEEWIFEIRADSFLHNMVRVAVGSMVDVAQGRMTLDGFSEALAGRERGRMGQTAPSCGLALVAVEY